MTQRSIYLDANSTHPLSSGVRRSLAKALESEDPRLSNPSSIHRHGQQAKALMAEVRRQLAEILGRPDGEEFMFCSGATEAINTAIRGFVRERKSKRRKSFVIASATEHAAVRDTLRDLLPKEHALVGVDFSGQLKVDDFLKVLEKQLRAPTRDILICLHSANNETGVVFDIEHIFQKIAEKFPEALAGDALQSGRVRQSLKSFDKKASGATIKIGSKRVWFLLDGAQALGKLDESILRRQMHYADACSFSAHKMGGAPGIGALWLRSSMPFVPFVTGGVQERKRRAGTVNYMGLLAWHFALAEWMEKGARFREKMAELRAQMVSKFSAVEGFHIHGQGSDASLPGLVNTLNFHFENCPEESLLLALDLEGYCVSSGSACNSGSLKASPVLLAMGYKPEIALSAIRVGLSTESTRQEVNGFIETLIAKVEHIRKSRRDSAKMFSEEGLAPSEF